MSFTNPISSNQDQSSSEEKVVTYTNPDPKSDDFYFYLPSDEENASDEENFPDLSQRDQSSADEEEDFSDSFSPDRDQSFPDFPEEEYDEEDFSSNFFKCYTLEKNQDISSFFISPGKLLKMDKKWLERCISRADFYELSDAEKQKHIFHEFLFSGLESSCGGGLLPENVNSMHEVDLPGPFVLQVNDISLLSQDKFQDVPSGITRCLKLSMTDGVQSVFGMEHRPIKDLRVSDPAGLKVVVKNVNVQYGRLMLVPEGLKVLGGKVEASEARRKKSIEAVNGPQAWDDQDSKEVEKSAAVPKKQSPERGEKQSDGQQAEVLVSNAENLLRPTTTCEAMLQQLKVIWAWGSDAENAFLGKENLAIRDSKAIRDSLWKQLTEIWEEVGVSETNREKYSVLLPACYQYYQNCRDVYEREVSKTEKSREQLKERLATVASALEEVASALGEVGEKYVKYLQESMSIAESLQKKLAGMLKLGHEMEEFFESQSQNKKSRERMEEFSDSQSQNKKLGGEIYGHLNEQTGAPTVSKNGFPSKKLEDKSDQLRQLQDKKNFDEQVQMATLERTTLRQLFESLRELMRDSDN